MRIPIHRSGQVHQGGIRVTDDNVAERIQVEIGDSSGETIAITGPLHEDDRVAIRGAENLREGAAVKIMVSLKSS